jgi:peptidoglycan/xylan/chitin deacetylase (PgdA/CDA1 family)
MAAAVTSAAVWIAQTPSGPRKNDSLAAPRITTAAASAKQHHVRPATAVAARLRRPGLQAVPVLVYHVIASPLPNAPYPGLYAPAAEFAAQMNALARAGYHAVTLDEVRNAWLGRRTLPARAIVISFDNGYHTQYSEALRLLHRHGWVGDENLQLTGLPPSQGGLSPRQVRALIGAGWELDTQGYSHADLITLDPAQLRYQVAVARRSIQRRFGVKADWFCYPSGHYNATVIAAVKAAGYVGATTVVAGWARPTDDAYRLPRLRVLGGTSPEELLALIADSRQAPRAPTSYPTGA